MKSFFNRFALAFPLLGLVFAAQVFSQAGELEEIIVTADKREASIQDIPIAVTAFSQDQLEARLINDAMNLQFNVPNMMFGKGQFSGGGSPRIRGIGAGAIGSAGDSGVGIHINGAYLNGSRLFETQYFDVERVEVLRGPQGTLYGRNTTGGALNMITAKANTEEMSGNFTVSVGNYDARELRAHVNIPINDELAIRLAGQSLERDGFLEDSALGMDIDDRDMYTGRFSLTWTPSDSTTVHFMAQYFEEDDSRVRSQKQVCSEDPTAVLGCLPTGPLEYGVPPSGSTIAGALFNQYINPVLGGLQGLLPLVGYPARPDLAGVFPANDFAGSLVPDDPRKSAYSHKPVYRAEETIITLEWIQDFGDLTFTSVSAYHDPEFYSEEDVNKAVPTGDWSNQLNYLSFISGLPALPYFVPGTGNTVPFAAYLGSLGAAALAPFAVELAPGLGQSFWVGNPYLAQYNTGVPLLMGDGTYKRCFEACGYDASWNKPEQFTQELRLQSNFDGDFNFMLGAFYMDYKTETHYTVRSSSLALLGQIFAPAFLASLGAPPVPLALGDPSDPYSESNPYMQGYDNDTRDYNLESWAVFGELYWDVSDQLSATVGLRYSDEEKNAKQRTCYLFFLPCGPVLGGPTFGYFNPKYEDDKASWKFNLTWTPSDDVLLYATVSSSYKSGGFNPISNQDPLVLLDPANGYFEPETIEAVELGTKMTLLNNSMQLNATAFFYDYQDMQVSKIVDVTSLNKNTDAEVMGAEIEINWIPAANLFVSLTGSWLDTEIKNFSDYDTTDPKGDGTVDGLIICNASVFLATSPNGCGAGKIPGVLVSQNGNEISNSPGFSYNLGLSYMIPMGEVDLILSTNYYYQDSQFARNNNHLHDRIASWDVWNASARFASVEDEWYVEAWIKNINDDDFVTGQYTATQVQGVFQNRFFLDPQTYGLTFGYNF